MITKASRALVLQSLVHFTMISLWLTVGSAHSQPTPGAPGGLARIELGAYYQPEECSVTPVRHGWCLPVEVLTLPHAQDICAMLSLDGNAQLAIQRNGFVVVPFGRQTNVIETYRMLRNLGVNAFVTSDALLHLYHVQFGDVLRCVETNEFYAKLVVMSRAILDESIRQQSVFSADLQEAAGRNAAFCAVALRLLDEPVNLPPDGLASVTAELDLIEAHAGFANSPIFSYREDYSQYQPRGHYTRSEALKRYFKAMMWYGRMAFLLKGSDNPGPAGDALVTVREARLQTLQAALIALALDRLEANGQSIAAIWNRIYAVTAFFVGLADDLTPYEYNEALMKVFGSPVNPVDLADEPSLFELKKELASLRNPEIFGGTGNCLVPPNATPEDLDRVLEKTKGMRLMGQRFIPDSYMLGRVVWPVTGPFTGTGKPFTLEYTQGGPRRCFPRGLDVLAVLGSELALNLLDRDGDTDYLGYDESMNELIRQFNSFAEADWNKNLYWSWLYALKALLGHCGEESPAFMRTKAWECKQLNAALASWTELRHDTILYAKQSYTVGTTSVPPTPESGYVEPVPEFWSRLLALTRMTRTGLTALEVLNSTQADRLLAMEDILGRLKLMAMTELAGQPLSAADCAFLNHFDLALAPLTNGIADGLDVSTTLVADVHTDSNTGQVLEEGVGFARLLVAACPVPDGQTFLYAGPTLSYYEFKWPMNDRLTDEAWAGLLAAGQAPAEPSWTRSCAWPVILPPEDADGDQLADSWEQAQWGDTTVVNDPDSDSDGDGLSNVQELRAGTNPQDPGSCLRVACLRPETGGIQLQWRSVQDVRYRVFYSEDLRNWYLLGAPITAQDQTTSLSEPIPSQAKCRFYRVAVVP